MRWRFAGSEDQPRNSNRMVNRETILSIEIPDRSSYLKGREVAGAYKIRRSGVNSSCDHLVSQSASYEMLDRIACAIHFEQTGFGFRARKRERPVRPGYL
jgi:hypothetical protein